MKRTLLFLATLALLFPSIVEAQHDHHRMQHDTSRHMHPDHGMAMSDSNMMQMPSAFSKNLPMEVNGSGTTWHPYNSPMYMNMHHQGGWNWMLHYGVFARYSAQNIGRAADERGGSAVDVPNWAMLMATRSVGRNGLLMVRGMFSADLLTVGGAGYPLLLQTGETWDGKPLVDSQHPHDLVSELSIGYSQAFGKNTDVYAYFGLPGEPAIGPPAFMHRPSALSMPSAPLSHHWQDATHITFGVATLGFRYKGVKLEGSAFTGREPDEVRYDFDRPRFDSYSARLSVSPTRALALQASYGRIESPETVEPEKDIERITASALSNVHFSKDLILSTSLIWGLNRNHHPGEPVSQSHSVLLEGDLQMKDYAWFTRLEWLQKDNEELQLSDGANGLHNHNIGSFTLGASRYLWKGRSVWLNLGLTGSAYAIPDELDMYYGSNPYSFEVFLRVVPARMKMGMGRMR